MDVTITVQIRPEHAQRVEQGLHSNRIVTVDTEQGPLMLMVVGYDFGNQVADDNPVYEPVNGEQVKIKSGEYAGMVGTVGATYPDGRTEVLFTDSDIEVMVEPQNMEKFEVTPSSSIRQELVRAIERARSTGMDLPEIAEIFSDEIDQRI